MGNESSNPSSHQHLSTSGSSDSFAPRALDASALNIQSAPLKSVRPAGFWRRFLATLIDGMFVSFVVFPVTMLVNFAGMLALGPAPEQTVALALGLTVFNFFFQMAFTLFYAGWFLSRKGATPGKMALKLRVYQADTSVNLSFWSAGWRETIGKLLSSLTLFIGFIMAGVRKDKRALHDLLFDSRVVHMEN